EMIQHVTTFFNEWVSPYWYYYVIGLLTIILLVILMMILFSKDQYVVYAKYDDGSHGDASYPMRKEKAIKRKRDLIALHDNSSDRKYSVRRYKSKTKHY